MRRTQALLAVSAAILERDGHRMWGYQLSRATSLRSGILYPILQRMLDAGWLTDGWEDPATISGRPPRRYYLLTDRGRDEMRALVGQEAS